MEKRRKLLQQTHLQPRYAGQTRLEQAAVSPAVAKDYAERVQMFRAFVTENRLCIQRISKFDSAFCDFLNHGLSEAKAWAAVLDAFPDFSQKGKLARSRRALQGWNKLDPGKTRPPLRGPCLRG